MKCVIVKVKISVERGLCWLPPNLLCKVIEYEKIRKLLKNCLKNTEKEAKMNYHNACRTCLGSEREMRSINSTVVISGEDVLLSDILLNFYSYKVTKEDSYPDTICINCVHHLTLTYSFKLLIEASYKTLTQAFINNTDSISDKNDCQQDSDDQALIHKVRDRHKKNKNLSRPYSKIIKRRPIKTEEPEQLLCVECKTQFDSIKDLKAHCNDNHPVKCSVGRDCQYCFEKFETFQSLVLHRKLHFNPFVCDNCWEGFLSANEFNAHTCPPEDYKSNNREKVFRQCDQCGKSYPSSYIGVHMRIHSAERPYSCKYCPKRFKVLGGLHSHILWNHKRTRNHKCEICNATFISSSARSSHIRKNHLKEKKYSCDSCGKRFFSKSELQRHSLTHTGVKNFHCHLCDKSYQTRYGLNVHLKSHSQITMNVLN